ncbi:MAG: VOC family protein [Oscillospiraceae bacterium]|nr:VOC family protein [Oscillospiraceae bacterium]
MSTSPMGHTCICVEDMERSIEFYKKAFDLEPIARLAPPGFKLVWMGKPACKGETPCFLELRTDDGHTGPYEKGYPSNHFALTVDDVGEYYRRHEAMGIIDFGAPEGPYFVRDIDGYSIEVMDKAVIERLMGE